MAAILKMANLTVIGPCFSLETVIYAFYGEFPIRMRISPYSTHNDRLDCFTGFVSEMESRLINNVAEEIIIMYWWRIQLKRSVDQDGAR